MKEKFIDFVEKFYKFMETKDFDPENTEDREIVQKRINLMMDSPVMKEWLKHNILFGKDDQYTNEVLMYLIDCATEFYNETDFINKIKPNTKSWILNLDIRISKIIKTN